MIGVCIGISAYVRILAIVLLPAILLDRAIRHWRRPAASQSLGRNWTGFAATRCAPLIAVASIVFSPWVIRNQILYGPSILLENQGPFNLWVGNATISPKASGERSEVAGTTAISSVVT